MTTPSRDTCSHVAAVEAALQISLAVLASDVVDYVIIAGFPEYVHTQVLRASVSISIMVIGVDSSALRALAAFCHPSPLLHPARPDPFRVLHETYTHLAEPQLLVSPIFSGLYLSPNDSAHRFVFSHLRCPHDVSGDTFPRIDIFSQRLFFSDVEREGGDVDEYAGDELEFRWTRTRILSHREEENLAQALERCSNTERHLSRKKRPRLPRVSVGRPAAASAVTAVSDNISCRAATVHPPRPSAPSSLNLVGLLSDIGTAPPPSPPSHLVSRVSPPSPLCPTYVDTGTEPQSAPLLCEVAVDATSVRLSLTEIHDPFAWSLARLVPRNLEWEQRFMQAIYLHDWYCWAEWFDSKDLPPLQRIYLNTLAEMFRPWCDPDHHNSVALYLNPIYNLFTHWWSGGYNALTFPTRPPEHDPRFCYSWLSDHKLHGQVPLTGRGFVVRHASGW
ncbi:hypothetical protein C8R43DRAFT_942000 [Mycena crocata]|nr:hypothetical protein C8R43DRAFT_942000 [Mycena crocata]